MDDVIAVRLPAKLAGKLRKLAAVTGRPLSQVVRYVLAVARPEDLPPSWVDEADAERIAAGKGDA